MGIDLGFLAEALVFYQRVQIVADGEMFKTLVRVGGYSPDTKPKSKSAETTGMFSMKSIERIPISIISMITSLHNSGKSAFELRSNGQPLRLRSGQA